MSDPLNEKSAPQFGTAEYTQQPGDDRCMTCNQQISGSYYRVNAAMTCPACAEQATGRLPKDTHKAFARGTLFGIGGALLGLILYSAVGIITGYTIGYLSLAVGVIVGKAIMMGSWGIGGRRYQILAVGLTYAAVSLSAIPFAIYYLADTDAAEVQLDQSSTGADASLTTNPDPSSPAQEATIGLVALAGYLVVLGLASPFLELTSPVSGLIGIVILLVGIQIAWKTTAGTNIEIRGPYQN